MHILNLCGNHFEGFNINLKCLRRPFGGSWCIFEMFVETICRGLMYIWNVCRDHLEGLSAYLKCFVETIWSVGSLIYIWNVCRDHIEGLNVYLKCLWRQFGGTKWIFEMFVEIIWRRTSVKRPAWAIQEQLAMQLLRKDLSRRIQAPQAREIIPRTDFSVCLSDLRQRRVGGQGS